jgi:hypothetical protein
VICEKNSVKEDSESLSLPCECFHKGDNSLKELDKKTVKKIRKLLKDGKDVPEICKTFGIPPEEWRETSIKYDFFK